MTSEERARPFGRRRPSALERIAPHWPVVLVVAVGAAMVLWFLATGG